MDLQFCILSQVSVTEYSKGQVLKFSKGCVPHADESIRITWMPGECCNLNLGNAVDHKRNSEYMMGPVHIQSRGQPVSMLGNGNVLWVCVVFCCFHYEGEAWMKCTICPQNQYLDIVIADHHALILKWWCLESLIFCYVAGFLIFYENIYWFHHFHVTFLVTCLSHQLEVMWCTVIYDNLIDLVVGQR